MLPLLKMTIISLIAVKNKIIHRNIAVNNGLTSFSGEQAYSNVLLCIYSAFAEKICGLKACFHWHEGSIKF